MAFIVAGWMVFLFFVWLPVEHAHAAFCFNNYDLGIYSQALTLLSLENLNPYLSTRDIKIFNDHFDPILLLFSPLTRLSEPGLLAIRVEMISIVLASSAPIWLWWNRKISKFEMLAIFFVTLFSPMTLMAAFYPSHPGTWALAPLAWLLAAVYAGRDRLAIAMLVLLLFYKEEFPVVGGALGVILILQSRRRLGIGIFTISVLWFFTVFFLRPIFLGKADYYTSAMLSASGLSEMGSYTWPIRLTELLFWIFTPVLLLRVNKRPGFYLSKYRHWIGICVSIAFVLVMIRVIGGYYGNHRAAPLAIISGFLLIGTSDRGFQAQAFRKFLFFIFLLGTATPFLELGSRVWRDKPFKKHCPPSRERVDALNQVVSYLSTAGAKNVLAAGNIVPHLVRLPGVAQIGASKADDFRFFVVEKYEHRNTWPLSSDEMSQVENEWRHRQGVKVLRDDQHVLLLENTHKL